MKRWNFKGGSASHGNSLSHRTLGSTGQCQDPGKVFKNKKMAGHMGVDRRTIQNLYVLKIDTVRQLVYVKGAVPGTNGNYVRIVDAVKGPFYPSDIPPPFPTYFEPPSSNIINNDDDNTPIENQIFAPTSETDAGIFKVPDDPY